MHTSPTDRASTARSLCAAAILSLSAFADAQSQEMRITRRSERPAQPGPAANFTGAVRVTPLFDAAAPSRVAGASVTFEPGARSAWHTHPRGQALIVTGGTGRVQQWGGPVREIREGDVVWTPPGVKHWHGAAPTTAMTHTAIQEAVDGRNVEWLEKVSDAQYGAAPTQGAAGAAVTRADSAAARGPYADIAPALDDVTRRVLFGEIWERPGLSKRDRSLVTVATLVAQYRVNELPYHLNFAQRNGVTRDELAELITHLAFYAGWPSANTAVEIARRTFAEPPR